MQDFRLAVRQLVRAPGFAVSAVLTLALGIGANTGIFSVLNGLLRPLPVPDPDQIVIISAELPRDETGFRFQFSYPALNDYRQATSVFSDVFAMDTRVAGLTAGGKTTQFVYHGVSGNTFTGLRLEPAAGRLFDPGEGESVGTEAVIVLGYLHWMRRFGGDPSVVGSTVRLDGRPARIVGVAPEGFHGLVQHAEIDGYVPLGTMRGERVDHGRFFTDRSLRSLAVFARMRPGVTVEDAQAAVDVIATRLRQQYPVEEKGVAARVIPERMARPVPSRKLSQIVPKIMASMLALAGLVLLIACLNVANLLLVRATAREREMAVRVSLGSGRGRLLRLLLVESLLISLAGLAVGLLFAKWATAAFITLIDPRVDIPLNLQFHYDWHVFAYAAAIAVVTGIVLSLAPALRASRVKITAVLHDGGYGGSSGRGRQRVRSLLVIAQVAGSLVLLIVAGLAVHNLQKMQWMDLGFDPDHMISTRLDPRQVGYSEERSEQFYEALQRNLRAVPGIESVSTAVSVPLGYIFFGCQVEPEGADVEARTGPRDSFLCNPVSPDYFETMRLPIVEGRAFDEHDARGSAPVAIVNETLAKRFWPDESAIGKRLVFPTSKMSAMRVRTVVGVARNSKYLATFEGELPYIYLAMKQDPAFLRVVHARVAGPPERFLTILEREVHKLDPEVPVADLITMRQTLDGGISVLLFRLGAVQAASMGVLGLLLAVIGVYGVVSYSAGQRTREMGIRLALGAAPRAIGGLVLGHGARLVVAGIVVGLGAAWLVARALSRFFVMVGATDTLTFAIVSALLGVIALAACYLPARKAMRVNPIVALRHE